MNAATIYDARRRRDQIFGDHHSLFGEPAWDILLDLHVHAAANRHVCISNACIAAAVPPTTGLRYISALEQAGLVRRIADPTDKRRHWLVLSDSGREKIDQWLAAIS